MSAPGMNRYLRGNVASCATATRNLFVHASGASLWLWVAEYVLNKAGSKQANRTGG
jgi:hypothetical protein